MASLFYFFFCLSSLVSRNHRHLIGPRKLYLFAFISNVVHPSAPVGFPDLDSFSAHTSAFLHLQHAVNRCWCLEKLSGERTLAKLSRIWLRVYNIYFINSW